MSISLKNILLNQQNILLTSNNQPVEDLTPTNKPLQTPVNKQPSTNGSPTNNRHYQPISPTLINQTTSKHIDDDVFDMSSDKSDELALGGCAQTLMRKQHKKQLQKQTPNSKLPRSIQERRKNSKLGKTHYTSKEFTASSASSTNIHCVVRPSDTVPCKRCAAASGRYAAASTGHLTDAVTMKTPKRRRRKTTASSTNNSSVYLTSKYQWSHSSYHDGRKYRGHRHQPSFHHHLACQSGGMVKLFPSVDRNGSMLSTDPVHRDEDDMIRGQQHHPLHHPAYKPCPKLLAPRKSVLKSSASASTLSEKKPETEINFIKDKKKKKKDQSGSNTGKTIWKGLKKLLSNHDDTKRAANKTSTCNRVIEKESSNKPVTSHKEDESSLSLSSSDESSALSPPTIDGSAEGSTSNNRPNSQYPPYDSSSSLSRSPTSSRPRCSFSIQKDTSLSSDGRSSQKSPNRVQDNKSGPPSDHATTPRSGHSNKPGKGPLSNCPISKNN